MPSIKERVDASVKILDEKCETDWRKVLVDSRAKLNLRDTCNCVLGLIYGSYWYGTKALYGGIAYDCNTWGFNCRFYVPDQPGLLELEETEYAELETEWNIRIDQWEESCKV